MSDKKRQQQYISELVSISGRANTHPLFWTSSLAVAIFRCRCFVRSNLSALAGVSVSRLMSCVRCYRATFNRVRMLLFFFFFFHLFILCSRQRSTRDCTKMPGFRACVRLYQPYEIVVFSVVVFYFFSSVLLCIFSFSSSLDKCVRNCVFNFSHVFSYDISHFRWFIEFYAYVLS